MVLVDSNNVQDLDVEWVTLIMDAKKLGFSTEDLSKVLLILKESGIDKIKETAV